MDLIVFVVVEREELLTHKRWRFCAVHVAGLPLRHAGPCISTTVHAFPQIPARGKLHDRRCKARVEGLISTSSASKMGFPLTVSLQLNAPHICLACCEANARSSEVICHKSLPLRRVKSFIHGLMRLVIQRVRPDW